LLPSDLSIGFKENQLKLLRSLALENKVDLHILHIMEGEELTVVQEEGKQELFKYFKDASLHFHLEKGDDIQKGILEFQKNNPVEILCMINNKHSFFENLFFRPVVHKVGFQVKVPFLVIPSGKYSTRSLI
jgi:DNA-binding cell septation regulator SpoVG